MARWLPYPLLSASLLAMWLLLNQSLEAAHLLLGSVLAVAGGRVLAHLQPPTGRVRRRLLSTVEVFWLVFLDIVRSNIAVARIVSTPRMRGRTAGFITLQLEVRHPGALACLACIITATPGTSWARYDAARNEIVIHVLDLIDEQAWVRQFKERYESRLKEIFE